MAVGLSAELHGQLAELRPELFAALQTATLRCDDAGKATLSNLLLRNFLQCNLYEQADMLVAKSTFPESASNNEWARYLYYVGRIKAIQLDYVEAHKNLQQAVRKAPTNGAFGFQRTVNKLLIIVSLLLGEIPDRALFRSKHLQAALVPYFRLTQGTSRRPAGGAPARRAHPCAAVHIGNLGAFNAVVERHTNVFLRDRTYTLILRLRHNVIKAGIRLINLSYVRISLADICRKLQLDSTEDAEYIVAKAIDDGVIDAIIDLDGGFVRSKEVFDVYSTAEPQAALNQRITFCLNMFDDTIRAQRYPPTAYAKQFETAEVRGRGWRAWRVAATRHPPR